MRNQLEGAILFQVIRAAGFPQTELSRFIFWQIFGKAIQKFSNLAIEFEDEIEKHGSIEGVRWLLPHFVESYRAEGAERIPKDGPLLVVANHPGAVDGLVISAFLDREDGKIIIADVPFFRLLTYTRQHIIFSPPVADISGRMQTIRESIQHLQKGGALLIFPRGRMEPDPSFMQGLESSVQDWSRSVEIIIKKVPEAKVVVSIIGGVISPQCMHHPITWFRNTLPEKQRLAFMYQMSRQVLGGKERYDLKPQVVFSEPVAFGNQKSITSDFNELARHGLNLYYGLWKVEKKPSPVSFSENRKYPDISG